MQAGELLEHWRSQISDVAKPYLWSDDEAFIYMLDAYRMFVRLTGGIADSTSDVTRIAVTAGDTSAEVSRAVLRIMAAYRESDGADVNIINQTDLTGPSANSDYGVTLRRLNKPVEGQIEDMVIGMQKGLVRFTSIPVVDDSIQTSVYRLPLVDQLTETSTFDDIDDEHIVHLHTWMKHLAYRKHDVETQDLDKSDKYEAEFRAYCAFVEREWERMKHKTRVVSYGGI